MCSKTQLMALLHKTTQQTQSKGQTMNNQGTHHIFISSIFLFFLNSLVRRSTAVSPTHLPPSTEPKIFPLFILCLLLLPFLRSCCLLTCLPPFLFLGQVVIVESKPDQSVGKSFFFNDQYVWFVQDFTPNALPDGTLPIYKGEGTGTEYTGLCWYEKMIISLFVFSICCSAIDSTNANNQQMLRNLPFLELNWASKRRRRILTRHLYLKPSICSILNSYGLRGEFVSSKHKQNKNNLENYLTTFKYHATLFL